MRLLRLWRLARYLQYQADQGCEVIAVPRWLAPELHKLIWERKAERAAAKWAERTAEVPLSAWAAVLRDRAERRLPHD